MASLDFSSMDSFLGSVGTWFDDPDNAAAAGGVVGGVVGAVAGGGAGAMPGAAAGSALGRGIQGAVGTKKSSHPDASGAVTRSDAEWHLFETLDGFSILVRPGQYRVAHSLPSGVRSASSVPNVIVSVLDGAAPFVRVSTAEGGSVKVSVYRESAETAGNT